MVLDYKDDTWEPLSLTKCVSLIHPVILRERQDKIPDLSDVRISQLESFIHSNVLEEKIKTITLPKSKLIDRKVWTKDGKKGISI